MEEVRRPGTSACLALSPPLLPISPPGKRRPLPLLSSPAWRGGGGHALCLVGFLTRVHGWRGGQSLALRQACVSLPADGHCRYRDGRSRS